MCWRAEGKTTGYRAALLGAAFLLSTAGGEGLGAQELPQEIVRLIETQAENGGGDPDGMVEYFTELLDRPIDLSMADMATLEACPLFTPFMTVSLLEYRREYGPVSSAAELALVDGFSPAVVELLQPFVTFGCVGSGGGQSRELKWYEKFSGKWTVRSKMDLERGGGFPDEGFPVPFYSRLRVDFEDRCSAGLTLENDRGERSFPDFCSFFISVQNLPLTKDGRFRLEAAVAGDFSLRFGQGLVLWNSFSMSLSENTANAECSPAILNVFDGAKNVAHLAPILSFTRPIGKCFASGCERSECISSDSIGMFLSFAIMRTLSSSSLVNTMPVGFCGEQKSMRSACSASARKRSISREKTPSL